MKQKTSRYLAYAVVPMAALALFISSSASAHGWGWNRNIDPEELAQRHQEMFQQQAEILGIDADTIKNSWAQGKNMQELAEELGLSQDDLRAKMLAARQAELKSQLQTLVEKGVITQAQADQRYSFMEQRQTNSPLGGGKGMGRGGMRGNWGGPQL